MAQLEPVLEPVTVVALLTPRPGRVDDVLAAFADVSPLVHREPGCELYSAHTDGSVVIMVERWTSRLELDAHARGAALARLNELNSGLLEGPYDVWFLAAVPLGDPTRGVIPRRVDEVGGALSTRG